jgi:hypothetical protein
VLLRGVDSLPIQLFSCLPVGLNIRRIELVEVEYCVTETSSMTFDSKVKSVGVGVMMLTCVYV